LTTIFSAKVPTFYTIVDKSIKERFVIGTVMFATRKNSILFNEQVMMAIPHENDFVARVEGQ
jgi:hypothetical protein